MTTRRNFLKRLGVGSLFFGALGVSAAHAQQTCRRVSGAGTYAIGPFDPEQEDGEPVFIYTDLGFDETMVFCKVSTNFEALRFPTASMGVVPLGAHEFFMDMRSERISSLDVQQGVNGLVALYTGQLRSETRLFSGENMRTIIEEHVEFGCRALNLTPESNIEISLTNFSMTANFNPELGHAQIFGEQATFEGRLMQGNIVITM